MPRFEDYVDAVYSYLEAHMPFEKGSIVALRATSILKESRLPKNPASLTVLNYILGLLTIIIDADVIENYRGRLYMFRKSELSCIIRLGRDVFIRIIGNLDRIRQRGPEAPSPNPYKNYTDSSIILKPYFTANSLAPEVKHGATRRPLALRASV